MQLATSVLGAGLLFALVATPAAATAGEAHICSTRKFSTLAPMNDPKYEFLPLDDATVFKCPAPIGDKTIPQLAAAGWHIDVLAIPPLAGPTHIGGPGGPLSIWSILIQKP